MVVRDFCLQPTLWPNIWSKIIQPTGIQYNQNGLSQMIVLRGLQRLETTVFELPIFAHN